MFGIKQARLVLHIGSKCLDPQWGKRLAGPISSSYSQNPRLNDLFHFVFAHFKTQRDRGEDSFSNEGLLGFDIARDNLSWLIKVL